ncbi:GNAT family N-acetyltransferase [Devosia rhodophyticola]|uniref:GNAT family N-acetyltransferase n=1 Tax=Devosia rhodophyticola TaxID=3026423 RepID=A0ABY7YW61_9HYPH|nr:GNAT family N-acetyltransferase [Devosia rhodophyticola]WDR05476.1 GNAT family N-acetyltransferase [Devosia rhodophyticola]
MTSALTEQLPIDLGDANSGAIVPPTQFSDLSFSFSVSQNIDDVEPVWRALEAQGIHSPGQSFDFIKLWVEARKIASNNQFYVVGYAGGEPIALLPLHRKAVKGVRLFTWFPGANVGAYAPLVDVDRLRQMSPTQRQALWKGMSRMLPSADLIYLRAVPIETANAGRLFDELGTLQPFETLYRSQYGSWEECDRLQRSKSRRKHDRQQGERLEALGEVSFEEVRSGPETTSIIDTMFTQRSARFKAMGIRDTFVVERLTDFYHQAAQPGTGVDVRLHVLRLENEIVAVRYNVVWGKAMYCLISSMSADPHIQGGSPGKQCLLRVMKSVFGEEIGEFDMGAGFTDEKRHWCNVQVPLSQHYMPLSARGAMVLATHQWIQRSKGKIKANKALMKALRRPIQLFNRVFCGPSDAS